MKILTVLIALMLPVPALAQAIDPAPLSQSDVLGREIGFGVAGAALDAQAPDAWTMGSIAMGKVAPDAGQSSDLSRRNAVAGYGFGESGLSAFLGYGQAAADLANDREQARIRSYFLGLSYARETGRVTWGAAAYVGRSHNVIDAPDGLTGSADHDGRLLGFSARAQTVLSGTRDQGFDLVLQGDALQHRTRDFAVTGYGGLTVDARDTLATRLRAEVGMPLQLQGWALRPYAALGLYGGSRDDLTLGGTSYGATDTLGGTQFSLGTNFTARSGLTGRVELNTDGAGHAGAMAGIGLRF